MDSETVFFILGIGLVALALIVSAVGLRFEWFPGSRAAQLGVTALFAAVVLGTAAFAWMQAEDEQSHREAELEEAAAANEAKGNEGEAREEVGSGATTTGTTTATTASVDGAQVFEANGCSGCHTLAAAGSSGTTGPDLDGALNGKSEGFIRTSIVDPNAEIAKNYPPDVMPQNFGTELSPEELDALVQYLAQSTGAKGKAEAGSGATTTKTTTATTASVDGAQVFETNACGGCHTLAAAGSTGTTGPDLDDVLKGKPEGFIKTSIADPNAEIAKGYPPNVMPQNFGTELSPEELDALVQYLSQSTGAKGGG